MFFCNLKRHPYFSQRVEPIGKGKETFILVPASINPVSQKYVISKEYLEPDANMQQGNSYDNSQYDRMQSRWQESNKEAERAAKGKSKAVYTTNSRSNDDDVQWPSDIPNASSQSAFPTLSSRNDEPRYQRFDRENYSGRSSSPPGFDERTRLSEIRKKKMNQPRSPYGGLNNEYDHSTEISTTLIDFQDTDNRGTRWTDEFEERKIREPELKPKIKHMYNQKTPDHNNRSSGPTPGKMYVID